jgi:hypothetical protein
MIDTILSPLSPESVAARFTRAVASVPLSQRLPIFPATCNLRRATARIAANRLAPDHPPLPLPPLAGRADPS